MQEFVCNALIPLPLTEGEKVQFLSGLAVGMRSIDAVRCGLLVSTLLLSWLIVSDPPAMWKVTRRKKICNLKVEEFPVTSSSTPSKPQFKCGLAEECAAGYFAFLIRSGAANVIGPKICFDGQIVMSGVMNNVGRGLNIALVDGETGKIKKSDFFNVYSGEQEQLLNFLKEVKAGTVILVASFDNLGTKMTDQIQEAFSSLGSSLIKSVKTRDSWVFAGAVGLEGKSPFEKLLKNDKETNFYGGWPGMQEVSGCFPQKLKGATNTF